MRRRQRVLREGAQEWNNRRTKLWWEYHEKGFEECPLCGCPIRRPLYQGPNGRLSGSRSSPVWVEVVLRCMCEICWQEAGEADWAARSWLRGGRPLGLMIDCWA